MAPSGSLLYSLVSWLLLVCCGLASPASAQKAPKKSQPDPPLHFTDVTAAAGIRYLGWGIGCVDLGRANRRYLFAVNGHVYPQVDVLQAGAKDRQRKLIFLNQRAGTFRDVSALVGIGARSGAAKPRRRLRRPR
jgi:hypothetical protein